MIKYVLSHGLTFVLFSDGVMIVSQIDQSKYPFVPTSQVAVRDDVFSPEEAQVIQILLAECQQHKCWGVVSRSQLKARMNELSLNTRQRKAFWSSLAILIRRQDVAERQIQQEKGYLLPPLAVKRSMNMVKRTMNLTV